jgi:cobalamin biosynthesis protein CobT
MLQIMGHFLVSSLKRRNLVRELQLMSYSDPLTHLGNRYALDESDTVPENENTTTEQEAQNPDAGTPSEDVENPENGEETPSKDAENKEGQPEDTNLDFDEIGDSKGNDQITTYSNQVTFLNNGYPYKKWVTDNFKKVISLLNQIL